MVVPSNVKAAAAALAFGLCAAAASANFAGTDVFVPSLGHGPGAAGSQWHACIWVHNPNASAVTVTFRLLLRDQANPDPQSAADTIPGGETRRYDDALATLFGVSAKTFGAVRVTSPAGHPVIVNARSYSKPDGAEDMDTTGQFFAAIPAAFAIGTAQRTELLGVYQTAPQSSSEYRYNFGFVETSGYAAAVTVTAVDPAGAALGSKDYALGAYQASQYNVADLLPSVDTTNARLEVAVTGGQGHVIAFGSGISNRANDPSTFEMSFRDELLAGDGSGGGLAAVAHDATLAGDGTAASPLSIAIGGVGKARLAAIGGGNGQVLGTDGVNLKWQSAVAAHDTSLAGDGTATSPLGVATGGVGKVALAATGGSNGQVLGTDGVNLKWQSAAAGLSLPWSGSANTSGTAFAVTNQSTGYAVTGSTTSTLYSALAGFNANGSAVYGAGRTGVEGQSSVAGGTGVFGFTGLLATPYSGQFGPGPVRITGSLSVTGTKAFAIDHPFDPENRELWHAAVESSEVLNLYSGNVVTGDDGRAEVRLPDWFEAINADFRYQLTCVGSFARAIVEEEIAGSRFTIRTDAPNVKVSWQVTARRNDAVMRAHPFTVERDKPAAERGTYLSPVEHGQPPERGVEWTVHPDVAPGR